VGRSRIHYKLRVDHFRCLSNRDIHRAANPFGRGDTALFCGLDTLLSVLSLEAKGDVPIFDFPFGQFRTAEIVGFGCGIGSELPNVFRDAIKAETFDDRNLGSV
jgi:hypothetical protein